MSTPTPSLTGAPVVVTGGASGLGAAVADRLARVGACGRS